MNRLRYLFLTSFLAISSVNFIPASTEDKNFSDSNPMRYGKKTPKTSLTYPQAHYDAYNKEQEECFNAYQKPNENRETWEEQKRNYLKKLEDEDNARVIPFVNDLSDYDSDCDNIATRAEASRLGKKAIEQFSDELALSIGRSIIREKEFAQAMQEMDKEWLQKKEIIKNMSFDQFSTLYNFAKTRKSDLDTKRYDKIRNKKYHEFYGHESDNDFYNEDEERDEESYAENRTQLIKAMYNNYLWVTDSAYWLLSYVMGKPRN